MKAQRFNQGKAMLSFLLQFPTAMAAFARVKEMGAIKYARDNWKLGGKPDHEYLDAAMRHLAAHQEFLDGNGSYYAEDTGCSHLAHASWNMWALQDLNYEGQTHDPELFAAMAEHWKNEKEKKQKSKIDEIVIGPTTSESEKPIKVIQDLNAEVAKVDRAVRKETPPGNFKLIAKTEETNSTPIKPSNTFSTQLWERHVRDTMRQFLDWLDSRRKDRDDSE